jgi:hypothetical protein
MARRQRVSKSFVRLWRASKLFLEQRGKRLIEE